MLIIAVDDEPAPLEELTLSIQEASPDSEVYSFSYPDDAIEFGQDRKIDVAFLDIQMPGMTGLELAIHLKKQNPNINVVFCTAYSSYMKTAFSMHVSGYLLKPARAEDVVRELDNLRSPVEPSRQRIYAQTFGNFEFFVDGVPVVFGLSKAKEMLAYLIDRNGAALSRKELASVLFEDEEYTRSRQDYLTKITRDLEKSLKAVNADQIYLKQSNQYSVDTSTFSCDAYDYEKGIPGAINRFHGEYMEQYEWASYSIGRFMN